MERPGILSQRRGFGNYGSVASSTVKSVNHYGSTLIRHDGTTLSRWNGSDWTAYSGTYAEAGNRLRFEEANKSFYFTSTSGVYKLESASSTPRQAGVPRALGGSATLATGTWFTTGNMVAYRLVWGYRDANNYVIQGAPSDRVEISNNSGASKSVSLTFNVPAGISSGYFYQLYRSGLSGGASTIPSDELSQIYEGTYTSGSTITINDITPTTLTGAYLYTNANTGFGIAQSNEQPPLAKDLCQFRQYMLYANTQRKQSLYITLLGVGNGALSINDTLIFTSGVTSFTLTASASENASVGNFLLDTSGTPSQNVQNTANSICRVLNNYASNTIIYASYVSGYQDFPGKMYLFAKDYTVSAFSITTNNNSGTATAAFSPNVPTSGTAVISSSETVTNRVYYSRVSQPEAVPLLNYFDVGSANFNIRRIVALQDSVFILKDEGIYRLVGFDPTSWQVSLFDKTFNLVCDESVSVLDNTIYCFTNQGVATISDSGSTIISYDIEDQLLNKINFTNISSSWGVSNPPDRKYIFWTLQNNTETYPTIAYVYQTNVKQWTTWKLFNDQPVTAGTLFETDGKLYFATSDKYVRQERKALTDDDLKDNSINGTITSVSGSTIGLSSVSGVSAGMILRQGTVRGQILSVGGSSVVVDGVYTYVNGPCFIDEPIIMQIRYNPIIYQNPAVRKHASRFQVFFGSARTLKPKVLFKTDYSVGDDGGTILPNVGEGWGLSVWGATPWGGQVPAQQAIRTYMPREKQRHSWIQPSITLQDSNARLQLEGFAIFYESMGEQQHN